ncbi:MAG: ABC transporter permease [Bacteroidia bacterium]|nr:ABC transporter permease [Bacteroidia bacterium]
MILKLAWRNIWRNKRRTLITATMIFMAVMLATVMQCVQRGVYDRNIDNLVSYSTGYIQVNAAGHHEDKTLETSVAFTPELIEKIMSVEGVKDVSPKIENVGLSATDNSSKETLILAVDPKREAGSTKLDQRIVEGRYFNEKDNAVLIGSGLAKRLNVSAGDTIVLLSIGYQQASANGLFPIAGVVELASPELNKRIMYLPIAAAQNLFLLGDQVSSISVLLDDKLEYKRIAAEIEGKLGEEYEVLHWQELVPELAQLAEGDKTSGKMFMLVLYIIISFGVFGTVLMMLAERKREFGVVTSIGMKRRSLAIIVVLENLIISFLGAIVGMILALPVVNWLHTSPVSLAGDMKQAYEKLGFEPVITANFYPDVFIGNASLVFVIALLLSLYPLFKISRINPIEYLRS